MGSRQNCALVFRALGWILLARAFLAFLPLRNALRLLDLEGRAGENLDPRGAAWAVQAVAQRIPGTRCLARSMALNAMLRRGGHDSKLRLGVVREADGGIIAHAWVTWRGHPLPDEDVSRFVLFG